MWYKLHQLGSQFYRVQEPGHVSFYLIQKNEKAILVDTGLGIALKDFNKILEDKGIASFEVLSTHLHCDHAGLNFLADRVHVSRNEFEKYQCLSDENQLTHYHNLLLNYKSWPDEPIVPTRDFSSKLNFIVESSTTIMNHDFEVIPTPGHTKGHLCFISHELRTIFLGDLVYDGMLYINLPDSNFEDYLKSLELMATVSERTGYQLLPCHNSIPLSPDYIKQVIDVCVKIKDQSCGSAQKVEENPIFKACDQYQYENVKIQITRK